MARLQSAKQQHTQVDSHSMGQRPGDRRALPLTERTGSLTSTAGAQREGQRERETGKVRDTEAAPAAEKNTMKINTPVDER